MIFVTVGTQLAFDRLIKAMDFWATTNPGTEVFAQIGPGTYLPVNFSFQDFVSPSKADSLFKSADLIVSHAGMGSILTAMRYRKAILIMPRQASRAEHRNDHQLATAKWLGQRPGVFVANEAEDVSRILSARDQLTGNHGISDYAEPSFTARLREFIDT